MRKINWPWKQKPKCNHDPVVDMKNCLIGGGKINWSFFAKEKWICRHCNKEMKQEWRVK